MPKLIQEGLRHTSMDQFIRMSIDQLDRAAKLANLDAEMLSDILFVKTSEVHSKFSEQCSETKELLEQAWREFLETS